MKNFLISLAIFLIISFVILVAAAVLPGNTANNFEIILLGFLLMNMVQKEVENFK